MIYYELHLTIFKFIRNFVILILLFLSNNRYISQSNLLKTTLEDNATEKSF